MKSLLTELTTHHTLSKAEARQALMDIASAVFPASQMSAFMTVYMMRPVTVDELEGFRDAMLELCVPVSFDRDVMDVCGTGGDGKNTFNISTLSSFVVAAAGQPVAKHGNYGVSSACGSSNVLEHFGYTFTNDVQQLQRDLDRANICFMHAPLFHPAMKNVAPIRRELGVKTFFNMLGPMVNPAKPHYQLVGVFNLELARQYAYLYQQSEKNFMILHALDGYDEVSLTGSFKYFTKYGEFVADPFDLGLQELHPNTIAGGTTVQESADVFLEVIQGNGTPQQHAVVIANAALALYTVKPEAGLANAVAQAREALESGKAYEHFKRFITK